MKYFGSLFEDAENAIDNMENDIRKCTHRKWQDLYEYFCATSSLLHISGKYTSSYRYPHDHPMMLKLFVTSPRYLTQLRCCTLGGARTECGSLCSLFFYCTMNAFPTVNSLPTMNSVTHTHDMLMKLLRAPCHTIL